MNNRLMADNTNQHLQLLDSLHRYGQGHEQTLYIITLANTYDQIMQEKSFEDHDAKRKRQVEEEEPSTKRLKHDDLGCVTN